MKILLTLLLLLSAACAPGAVYRKPKPDRFVVTNFGATIATIYDSETGKCWFSRGTGIIETERKVCQ